MAAFAKKVYLELPVPSEADFAAGRERVLRALGQEHVHVTMGALQELYPTLQEADYRVTVTLCPADGGWDLIRVEQGDTRDALYGAALLAGLFSDRLLPVAEPFAGGYFEGQLDIVATELPDNDAGLSGEDWVAAHPDTAQEYAEQCFAAAGVTGRPAQRMARAALAMRDEQGVTLRAAMTQVYCARLCYVLVTSVGFLLILLILAAIGNLPNLAFKLPNREKLNDIGGAALGAVNGVCFGILLCWALQFAGPVIGRDTLAHTALAKALLAIDVLTLGVGV